MTEFREIEVSAGRYIGWHKKYDEKTGEGQQVTLKVFTFDETGGTDFNGKTCPRLVGTLVEDAENWRNLKDDPTKETIAAGETVTVEGGTANLKKGLLLANPKRDDLVRLTFTDTYKTDNGTGKVIKVEHAPASQTVSEDDI